MGYVVESFGISDLGLAREKNEDVFREIPSHRFFVLADGMGGHNAGEVAAKEAVHHVSAAVCRIFSPQKESSEPEKSISDLLYGAVIAANRWVHQLSEQKEEFNGMGTTLCCLLLHENTLVCANVGDSRIYRFKNGLQQITEDHRVPPEINGRKNVITKALGTNPHVEPSINIFPVEEGEIYFLCSDGLTDYVPDEEISKILQEHICIKSASHELIKQAKIKGGGDNITVLMIRVLHDLSNLSR